MSEKFRVPRRAAALAAVSLVLLAGCGQAGSGGGQEKTVTVLAAASLTESFDELSARFTAEHPGVRVQFDYAGSSTLAEQLKQGRQADVFASADTKNMDKVAKAGLVAGQPQPFATNRLEIAVPKGNPGHVGSLADLNAPGRKVVTCAAQVPCGSATQQVERGSGIRLRPVSEENDVKSVLRKVTAGEADAGLVYVSDVAAASGQVDGVPFPEAEQGINTYPIAQVGNAPDPVLAGQFVDFVRGPAGRAVLGKHGFGAP